MKLIFNDARAVHLMSLAADQRGAFGSATLFVGGDIHFGRDRLRDAEEQLKRQQAA